MKEKRWKQQIHDRRPPLLADHRDFLFARWKRALSWATSLLWRRVSNAFSGCWRFCNCSPAKIAGTIRITPAKMTDWSELPRVHFSLFFAVRQWSHCNEDSINLAVSDRRDPFRSHRRHFGLTTGMLLRVKRWMRDERRVGRKPHRHFCWTDPNFSR